MYVYAIIPHNSSVLYISEMPFFSQLYYNLISILVRWMFAIIEEIDSKILFIEPFAVRMRPSLFPCIKKRTILFSGKRDNKLCSVRLSATAAGMMRHRIEAQRKSGKRISVRSVHWFVEKIKKTDREKRKSKIRIGWLLMLTICEEVGKR